MKSATYIKTFRLLAVAAMLAEAVGLPLVHPLFHRGASPCPATCSDDCESPAVAGWTEAALAGDSSLHRAVEQRHGCPICQYTQTQPRQPAPGATGLAGAAGPALPAAPHQSVPPVRLILPSCSPRAPPGEAAGHSL